MRRSRYLPAAGLLLCAVLTAPSASAAGTTAPAGERAVQRPGPHVLAQDPPWSGCAYYSELNQPYWRGHCDGYEQGERDGRRSGWSCSRWGPPEFRPTNAYELGYATGYKVAYRYYYRAYLSKKACELRYGQDRPGPITR
ncbi:hypothetical protein GCM10010236_06620 [Streptomyces eurythermus]|nr:hypothetical protein GCM10010236_06620 [Streptomyces eurythermus]